MSEQGKGRESGEAGGGPGGRGAISPTIVPRLACPICTLALNRSESAFRCARGHSFDIAREGYVNLMTPRQAKRAACGDSAEMLTARRHFLEAGYFEPLLALLAREAHQALEERPPGQPATVLEVGCGEGYYIGGLSRMAGDRERELGFLGTDISKAATRLASKRHSGVLFFVSDVHERICVQDSSVAVLLDVFAPRHAGEFARVVEPGGCALIVIPAPSHLASLRRELGLLDIEAEKEQRVIERLTGAFALRDRAELSYPLTLPPEAANWVAEMGPSHWHDHASAADGPVETETAFVVLRFERVAGP